jgi:hypothetical protein
VTDFDMEEDDLLEEGPSQVQVPIKVLWVHHSPSKQPANQVLATEAAVFAAQPFSNIKSAAVPSQTSDSAATASGAKAAPVVEMATQEDLATPPLVPLIDRALREVKSTQILAQMQIPEWRSRRRAATADEDSIERASRRVA